MARCTTRILIIAPVAVIAIAAAVLLAGYFRQRDKLPPDLPARAPGVLSAERLTYSLSLNGTKVGDVRIRISSAYALPDGRRVHEIRAISQTTDEFSAILFERGTRVVLVDAATLLPIEFEFRSSSGTAITPDSEKHQKLVFDRVNLTLNYFAPPKDGPDTLELRRSRPIPANAQHWSSLIAGMRIAPLAVGTDYTITLADQKRTIDVVAHVESEEPYSALDGTQHTALVLKVTSDFGNEKRGPIPVTLWVDKDERFPVRIDAKTKIGTISATLTERILHPAAADNEGDGNHTGTIPVDTTPGETTP